MGLIFIVVVVGLTAVAVLVWFRFQLRAAEQAQTSGKPANPTRVIAKRIFILL